MTTAWGQILPEKDGGRVQHDIGFYVFAVFAGMFAGWIDIKVGDLLLTALVVVAPCMVLGLMRPRRPWRWVVIVGLIIPIAELMGYFLLTYKPSRAQVYESLLAFLPAIAGAYGGAMLQQAIRNIMGGK